MASMVLGPIRSSRQHSRARFSILFFAIAIISFISGCLFFTVVNDDVGGRGFRIVSRPVIVPREETARPTRIVFFLDGFDREIDRMKKGGAGGEIRLFHSMMSAIRSFSGIQMDVISAIDSRSEQALRSADLIVSDQYRLESLLSVVPDALSDRATACKLRFIDFWGTPSEQNHIQLDLKQFLVPYPNPWNEFLGFSQHPIASMPDDATARPMVLLHGKLGRYFRDHLRAIEALTDSYVVAATVPDEQLDGFQFPQGVANFGICNSTVWERLLSEASAVIGFGDPVLAPTALESIAAGCPYIFARYPAPRSLTDLPAYPIRSQHDFMLAIGPPYAYAVDVREPDEVLEAVQKAILERIKPWIPSQYTAQRYDERLRAILDTNLCSNLRRRT